MRISVTSIRRSTAKSRRSCRSDATGARLMGTTSLTPAQLPRHVAIIMDGNGRWARKRHLPREAGHLQGVKSVREVVRASVDLGLENLTLFAFSSENWKRPRTEIVALMGLFRAFFRS